MEPNWHGPYRIHEVLGKGTFKLCNVDDSNKVLAQIYNMTQLKLYHQRDEDAPPADDEDSPLANPPTNGDIPPANPPMNDPPVNSETANQFKFPVYGHTQIYTHATRNAITLVWGLLRLAPIIKPRTLHPIEVGLQHAFRIHLTCFCNSTAKWSYKISVG